MPQTLDVDYLVVGAGATGMAFTDALVAHADVQVALVDRREAPGGHWLDDYPFVRLHQASAFYGVASTLLGEGRLQTDGPEAGLQERATAPEITDYYARVLRDRLVGSGRVTFYPSTEYVAGRGLVSHGQQIQVGARTRVVDARYLSPQIPALTPPPFGVADRARVVPVNDLPALDLPSQVVVVGSGKTATDACIWLLGQGVDPDAITWVRPREPWMFDRAVLQPDPVVYVRMAADVMTAAHEARSPDDMFLRLEESGVMVRIDSGVTPTMAKTPTIGRWEVELLRTIENVLRLGHVRHVEPHRLVLADGEAPLTRDAVVVHCAAPGLRYSPLVPIWGAEAITLQPVRTGFPCFGAALIGFVEATLGDDEEKNRYCVPSPYADTPTDWARMQYLGGRSSLAFASHPAMKTWVDSVALNPARVPPELQGSPELQAENERFRRCAGPGMARMAELAGLANVG